MKILLVTDAWFPQVNGVVRTLDSLRQQLRAQGHRCCYLTPKGFCTIPCPTYPEIRLALAPGRRLGQMIERFGPDCIHIATEGPLGLAARRWCLRHGFPFTTAYHTRFPEYVQARLRTPLAWTYAFERWFHASAQRVMVATESIRRELALHGIEHSLLWSRGVDTGLFRPRPKDALAGPRPIHLYVGRVAVEKNLEAFLNLDLEGTRYVVGDGPQLKLLSRRYPHVHFTGAKQGEELARIYASADVFAFPSRTDTFGLVMLEALACGVPVAAYPVPGPLDVIGGSGAGCLDEDLGRAIRGALKIDPALCRARAMEHSWATCAEKFVANLSPVACGPNPVRGASPQRAN